MERAKSASPRGISRQLARGQCSFAVRSRSNLKSLQSEPRGFINLFAIIPVERAGDGTAGVLRWFRHDGFSSVISLAQTIVDEEHSCRCSYIVCEISRCLGWHCRVVNELFTRSVSMIFVRLPDSLFTLAPFVS